MNGEGARLPRWFWLLPVLAAAAWWPVEAYWASDDFLAVHYAQDLGRALADFVGPQDGASDTWFFFRPLVTLSWWLDAKLGGGEPWLAHASNAAMHGVSAMLVGLLWTRGLGFGGAFFSGLWWALLPSHAGTVAWAVGRTDGRATPWLLASMWLLLRFCQGRQRTRLPALLCFVVALGCKEVAFAGLPLAFLLPMLVPVPDARVPTWRERLGDGVRAGWPFLPVFAAFFAWRYFALGRVGGYLGASYEPLTMATGLWHTIVDLLVPVRWSSARLPEEFAYLTPYLPFAAAAPLVWAAGVWLARAPRMFVSAWLLFLVACAPMASFLAGWDLPFNLRYYYLPTAALAGLVIGAGRIPALLAFTALAAPFVAARLDVWRADRADAAMHRMLLREVQEGTPAPLFVAGLPYDNGRGTAMQMHYGIDRMLEPPFGPGHARLFALRAPSTPLAMDLGTDVNGERLPFALPQGTTLFFRGTDLLMRAVAENVPKLTVQVDGGTDCSFARLLSMAKTDAQEGALRVTIRTPGVSPPAYRFTFFTATGYFCVPILNRTPNAPDGEVALRDLFGTGRWAGPRPLLRLADPSTAGKEPHDSYLLDGLCIATTHDLRTDFPVLVEALAPDAAGHDGVKVTHRAREMISFAFDRQLPKFVRLTKGQQ